MAKQVLTKEFAALALTLQEAALALSLKDICAGLSDCLNDLYPGQYCWVADVFGDAESGDVVYCCGGQYMMAPYEIGMANGKRTHQISTDQAKNVLPRTVYDEEADESDLVAGMDEAKREMFHVERFPGSKDLKRPYSERFISKDERDSASGDDFAGSNKSFPILKPSDVMAAVHSIGRGVAGGQSATSLKNKIKAIAKRKGWAKYLPQAWQTDSESSAWAPEGVLLVESSVFCEAPRLQEGATKDYPIKLISPGRGSSGYYPPEVLKKAGESAVFKAGTQMFWNHDTDAEESARPEGDLNRLAAVTTTDATWNENGHDGPGLYARAKVFSDYADKVKEKGPHIGLSIRAGGERNESAKGPDGKPGVITALKNAASVDFVTKAGRDGKIFTESQKTQTNEKGDDMDKAEVQALINESMAPLQTENKRLKEHIALIKAPSVIREALNEIRLPDAAKRRIIERLGPQAPLTEAGEIDKAKIVALVETEAQAEAKFLNELGYGNDVSRVGVTMTEAERTADANLHESHFKESQEILANIFIGKKLGKGGDEVARELRDQAREAFISGREAA